MESGPQNNGNPLAAAPQEERRKKANPFTLVAPPGVQKKIETGLSYLGTYSPLAILAIYSAWGLITWLTKTVSDLIVPAAGPWWSVVAGNAVGVCAYLLFLLCSIIQIQRQKNASDLSTDNERLKALLREDESWKSEHKKNCFALVDELLKDLNDKYKLGKTERISVYAPMQGGGFTCLGRFSDNSYLKDFSGRDRYDLGLIDSAWKKMDAQAHWKETEDWLDWQTGLGVPKPVAEKFRMKSLSYSCHTLKNRYNALAVFVFESENQDFFVPHHAKMNDWINNGGSKQLFAIMKMAINTAPSRQDAIDNDF